MTMQAKITALTHDGRGITQVNGKTTFIEGALPDEEVSFSYLHHHGKYDEARVTEILTPSPERTEPVCQHFSICGGCALQHMSPSTQREMKQKILLDQLQHFGGIKPLEILPPLAGPVVNYRRKARMSVKYVGKKQKVLVGFHEKKGRYIADIDRCENLAKPVDGLITPLKELIQNLKSYQHIPQIEVTVTEKITALVFRHLVPLATEDLDQLITFAQQHQLQIYLQPQGPQSIHLLYPESANHYLSYELPEYELELEFSPTDFIQINSVINQRMISKAIALLDLKPTDQVLDLFCGIGNFTLPIAKHCQHVIGIEGDKELINRAQNNATKNKITNVSFYAADLNIFSLDSKNMHANKILLDPPRTGALAIIQQLGMIKAEKIVYVSCNPATLARDAGELAKIGYTLTKVGIMDMFPQTHHVEAIAVFEMS